MFTVSKKEISVNFACKCMFCGIWYIPSMGWWYLMKYFTVSKKEISVKIVFSAHVSACSVGFWIYGDSVGVVVNEYFTVSKWVE